MLKDEINERFLRLAKVCRPLTNCCSMLFFEYAKKIWTLGDSFIFSYDDHGVNRLAYFATDFKILEELLRLPQNGNFCIDAVTKNPTEIENAFEKGGFKFLAKLKRLVNADCREILNVAPSEIKEKEFFCPKAALSDVYDVNKLLWTTFDTRISRLLNDDELAKVVEKGNVFVHRNENEKLDAVLQLDVLPRKFYINQVVNISGTPVIHSMMQNALLEYVSGGGKYVYAWVEECNIASVKFHAKYGMQHDGLWNLVYIVER